MSSKRFERRWRLTDDTKTDGPAWVHEPPTPCDPTAVLDEFTAAWEQGEVPSVDDYLDRLDAADSQAAVELIYREFCLSEADGCTPDVCRFLSRFPQHKTSLERLIQLHLECPPSLLDRWMQTIPALRGIAGSR